MGRTVGAVATSSPGYQSLDLCDASHLLTSLRMHAKSLPTWLWLLPSLPKLNQA